jgi:Poxvirus A22 protein.
MFVFFDIGVKNFCYFRCKVTDKKLELINFEVVKLQNPLTESVIKLLDDLKENEFFFVEIQNYRNTKCIKIETIIITYLIIHALPHKRVSPFRKIKLLQLDSSSYTKRKNAIISYGEKIVNNVIKSNAIKQKIENLKKKDDFYDCLLMAITELSDGTFFNEE